MITFFTYVKNNTPMACLLDDIDNPDSSVRMTRPSLAQVNALIDFIQKHPDLADTKLKNGVTRQKAKKLWIQLSNIANSLEGTLKSTKGWMKYWSDKKRSIMMKQKQIEEGKLQDTLSGTDQKIYDLCQHERLNNKPATRRKRGVKEEDSPDEDNHSEDDLFPETEEVHMVHAGNDIMTSEADERQLNMMEKLADVMDRQAQALSQMAQATQDNSKALERLAEASHIQALAVDRVATTFDSISSSVHDVRNAIAGIDYTLKRCYPATPAQQRTTNNLFS